MTTNQLWIASTNRPTSPSESPANRLTKDALPITLMMSALISGAFCMLLANVQAQSYALTAYMALRYPKPNWSQITCNMLASPPSACPGFRQIFSHGVGRILFDFITYGPILLIEIACIFMLVTYTPLSWAVAPIVVLIFQVLWALTIRPLTIYSKMKAVYGPDDLT